MPLHQTLTLPPFNSVAPHQMLGDISCDPIHLHHHGPPSPGLQDDYFELSEHMLVRKLHDLRKKSKFKATKIPSLLGPISLSRNTSVASDNVSENTSSLGDSTSPPRSVTDATSDTIEKDNIKELGESDGKEDEPTITECQGKEDLQQPTNTHADECKETDHPSFSSPTKQNGSMNDEVKKQSTSENVEKLPWEGREISIPSPCSSNSATQVGTSSLPPPPKAPSIYRNHKSLLKSIKLRTVLTPLCDTVGSDATSATASLSYASAPPSPSPSGSNYIRFLDKDGNEKSVFGDDDENDENDDEVSIPMQVVDEEDKTTQDEKDGEGPYKKDKETNLGETVLLSETIDWFTQAKNEEDKKGKSSSNTQKDLNTISDLDLIRSSSFTSSVKIEAETGNNEDERQSYFPESPKRQTSLGSLDLVRSSSFTSSIREVETEDTGDNSGSDFSSNWINGGRTKSLTWRIGGIESQKQPSEHEDDSGGEVSNSTGGGQLNPLTLTRVVSPSSIASIDSNMTPSQFQWQERSISSLGTSLSSASYVRSPPSRSNSKKKKRVWKIGKRNKSGKFQEQAQPTTLLEEEEEESPSPVKQREGIMKPAKIYPKHRDRRRTDLASCPPKSKEVIKKNHKAMLSQELFMKLSHEDDFDEFIKLNRISFSGDMLLGRMLRERTRIQCKRDMLHNELEMYIRVHCASRTPGDKSVSAISVKSEDRSVLFAI